MAAALLSMFVGLTSSAAADRLEILAEGTYANTVQYERQLQLPEAERNKHLRVFVKRVEGSAFGEDAYYVEWQDADAPGKITRQRIYGFERDGAQVVLRLHIFPNEAEFRARTGGAHLDPTKLAGIGPGDMVDLPGCDIYLAPTASGYAGAMALRACKLDYPGLEPDMYSWTQMEISDGRFSYKDSWRSLDDNGVTYALSPSWYVFFREEPTD